ncbi:hypothetical protein GCM10010214_10900 [Streptomyces abikoensis]|nr:hypothetical protein GCM10010214_10900 [Streptomyces abikoensis]
MPLLRAWGTGIGYGGQYAGAGSAGRGPHGSWPADGAWSTGFRSPGGVGMLMQGPSGRSNRRINDITSRFYRFLTYKGATGPGPYKGAAQRSGHVPSTTASGFPCRRSHF